MRVQRAAVIDGRYQSWYEDMGSAKPSPRDRGVGGYGIGKMIHEHPAAEVAKEQGDRISR